MQDVVILLSEPITVLYASNPTHWRDAFGRLNFSSTTLVLNGENKLAASF